MMRKTITVAAIVVGLFLAVAAVASATDDFATGGGCVADATPQLCDPATDHIVDVSAESSMLEVQYTTSDLHCSNITVSIWVDGGAAQTSGVLPPNTPTQVFTFGPFPAGSHTVSIQATGIVSGCNSGTLTGWGGNLQVDEVLPLLARKQAVADQLSALDPTAYDKSNKSGKSGKSNNQLEKAIEHIDKSLNPDLWDDGITLAPKDGKKVFDEESKAVKDLEKLNSPDVFGEAIASLVAIDKELAEGAIKDAWDVYNTVCFDDATTKACEKAAKELAKAAEEMLKGDEEIDKGHSSHAIKKYKKAWEKADKALKAFVDPSINDRFIQWVERPDVVHLFSVSTFYDPGPPIPFYDEGHPLRGVAVVPSGSPILFGFEYGAFTVGELQASIFDSQNDIELKIDTGAWVSVKDGFQPPFVAVPGSGPAWSWDHDGDGLGDVNTNGIGDWDGAFVFWRYEVAGMISGTHTYWFRTTTPGGTVHTDLAPFTVDFG